MKDNLNKTVLGLHRLGCRVHRTFNPENPSSRMQNHYMHRPISETELRSLLDWQTPPISLGFGHRWGFLLGLTAQSVHDRYVLASHDVFSPLTFYGVAGDEIRCFWAPITLFRTYFGPSSQAWATFRSEIINGDTTPCIYQERDGYGEHWMQWNLPSYIPTGTRFRFAGARSGIQVVGDPFYSIRLSGEGAYWCDSVEELVPSDIPILRPEWLALRADPCGVEGEIEADWGRRIS